MATDPLGFVCRDPTLSGWPYYRRQSEWWTQQGTYKLTHCNSRANVSLTAARVVASPHGTSSCSAHVTEDTSLILIDILCTSERRETSSCLVTGRAVHYLPYPRSRVSSLTPSIIPPRHVSLFTVTLVPLLPPTRAYLNLTLSLVLLLPQHLSTPHQGIYQPHPSMAVQLAHLPQGPWHYMAQLYISTTSLLHV